MLSVAKVMEDERGYLLIKLFATTGILLQELPKVTVETVESGKMVISSCEDKRIVNVPKVLRAELLSYATSNMITTGPIFVTHSNTPLSRSNVTVIIQKVCADANIPNEKVSPPQPEKTLPNHHCRHRSQYIGVGKTSLRHAAERRAVGIGWEG